jgi:hypothetical protein
VPSPCCFLAFSVAPAFPARIRPMTCPGCRLSRTQGFNCDHDDRGRFLTELSSHFSRHPSTRVKQASWRTTDSNAGDSGLRKVKRADLFHETEAGERHHARDGTVVEEQIGCFDWAVVCVHDVGFDLCSGLGTSLDAEPFQRSLGRNFHIDRELGGEPYGVVHGIISVWSTARWQQNHRYPSRLLIAFSWASCKVTIAK